VSAGPRELLRRHGLHLSRELGQNFLVDSSVADRLATLAGVEAGDRVVEVGTGLGLLTRSLARRAEHVVTIEIDSGVVRALEAERLLPENVELIHADALGLDLRRLIQRLGPRVRLVANLPYSAATPLLRRLLDLRDCLLDWSVMVQHELAVRLVARPGSKDYGSFGVLHQLTVDVQQQLELGPKSFFPVPKVRSSFVRIWPRPTALLGPDELPSVERVVRQAFAQRRKTIFNCLRAAGYAPGGDRSRIDRALSAAGIEPNVRAEVVPAETLLALARALVAGVE
jgi:16S rRNA (adenine1518-N6/adenine1519-N6)-dimethyltransferase